MSQLLYHIAPAKDVERAARSGKYVPATLATEGFVHCSYREQVAATAQRRFRGQKGLLLLEIDPTRLTGEVRVEVTGGGSERFPHVYGPLPMTAILAIRELRCGPDGSFDMPCLVTDHAHDTALDRYLAQHYVNADTFADTCGIARDELDDLIRRGLVAQPSYVVRDDTLTSYVFGTLPAPGATPGEYFHPAMASWVAKARYDLVTHGANGALERAQRSFQAEFAAALRTLDRSLYRLPDAFTHEGEPIAAGLDARLQSAWEHFQAGTFGLCVANPDSALAIARKEVLQEQLTAVTDNGAKQDFAANELPYLRALIDAYAAASMPFSPIEYPRSSRKRLVEELRRKVWGEG